MGFATLALAAVAMATGAMARAKLVGVKSQAILEVLSKGRFTADRISALQNETGDVEPQQLHLSLTNDPTSMMLVYVTMADCNGTIQYWPADGSAGPKWVDTIETTYSAGIFGWSGAIHTGVMVGLTPSARYTYVAGCNNGTNARWSEQRNFSAAGIPNANANTYIAVTADMGTIVPLGWQVAEAMGEEHTLSGHPFDMVIVAGDLSYATVDPPNNEVEWTWDAFGTQNEIFTSTAPYMATVGNHEDVPGTITNASGTFDVNFAAFTARYHMPYENSNGNQNLWFSYDFGSIHFTSISSESNYSVGSPQWNWVEADLAAANARRNITPFLIFCLHRPIMSVDLDEYTSHIPGAPLSRAFEPLFKTYKVDLVIQGHEHEYERTHAIYNGTIITMPSGPDNATYVNPGAPIYVVQGASGAMQEESWLSPIPAWSAVHMENVYGYGRMAITGGSSLNYTFIDTDGTIWDAFQIVRQ